jgi:hypothetical protein
MRGPTGTVLLRCALVAALLTVPGCSGDPEKPGTLPTRSQSPTPTSTLASPETPEEQVEAAVRAYYAELTRAAQTQDTDRLSTLSTKGCPCYGYVTSINDAAERDQTSPEAAWRVIEVRAHDVAAGDALAEVKYEVAAYTLMDSSGDVIRRFPARVGHVDLSLVRVRETWIIGNSFDLES